MRIVVIAVVGAAISALVIGWLIEPQPFYGGEKDYIIPRGDI